jgi:WD40 repeat protein
MVFTGCYTDPKIIPELGDCPTLNELISILDYPDAGIGIGDDIFIGADSGMTYCKYIPGNNDEIISYYSGYLSSNQSNLVKYNLLTHAFFTIIENPEFYAYPDISSTGWLLFTLNDSQLWKVKTNGDSLTQLTHNGANFEYTWSPDGERFIYKQDYPVGIYNTVIADKNGNYLFSIGGGYKIRKPAWSPDGRYIACGNFNGYYTEIDLIDTMTWEINNLVSGNDNFSEQVYSIDFYPDSKNILWSTKTELKKTNIETGITEVIATTCDSQKFDDINISDDDQNIIVKKTVYTYYDSKHLFISSKIFLLDAQGNEIEEIIF